MEIIVILAILYFVVRMFFMKDNSPKGESPFRKLDYIREELRRKAQLRDLAQKAAAEAAAKPTTVEVAVPEKDSQTNATDGGTDPNPAPPKPEDSLDLNNLHTPAFLRARGITPCAWRSELEAKEKRIRANLKASETRSAKKDRKVTEEIRDLLSLADSIPQ